jgi:hypothetical protein
MLLNNDSQVLKLGEDHTTENFVVFADVCFADVHETGALNVVGVELSAAGLDCG